MPFERYLRPDDHAISNNLDHAYYYQDHRHAYDDADCHFAHGRHECLPDTTYYDHHHPHVVQLQIPQFMLNGPPILAPGGGAEVLPPGLLDTGSDSFASSWFASSGFSPFHSALISGQVTSGSAPSDGANAPAYPIFPPNVSRRAPSNFSPHFTGINLRRQSLPEPPSLEVSTTYASDLASSPPSTSSSSSASYVPSNICVPDPVSSLPPTAPSPLGLPVYSTSGFDVLAILSRVANRPSPAVKLGPVDLSCAFVIVDVRRYDCPIVYASPAFCHMTGYSEQEVLGRNCRFLQSPTGNVAKGEPRCFASPEAVAHMRKLLSSSKECQTTLVNYKKGGQAFINLITVIPLRGGVHNTPEEVDDVAYHIGFQVDLTEQPNRILDKLRDGSYCADGDPWGMNNSGGLPDMTRSLGQLAHTQNTTNIGPKGGRHGPMMSIAVSKELKNLIADTSFTDSVPISTGTNMSGPCGAPVGPPEQASNATTPLTMLVAPPSGSTSVNRMSASGNTMAGSIPVSLFPSLSLLLLEFLPDFLLVLSLKGAFLYVAPSVRLVLGYEPQELVGRSISDVCHPADLVPLMRELKEGSVCGFNTAGANDVGSATGTASNVLPKSVDLLFRALPKTPTSTTRGQETSVKQSDLLPSPSASGPISQSPLSSGTLCSDDPSNGTPPPYVWLECRGRLHVEPGKGRKAIILSGRARWMPVVRWSSIDKAGGVGSTRCRGEDARGPPLKTAVLRPSEMSAGEPAGTGSVDPLEFWALLSPQGTFLVASASVRDVLGWGTSEVIGRSIWAMATDSRSGMRERVEAELAKLDTPEGKGMADPPPTVVTTSLIDKELHVVPVRLVFFRTPRSHKHAPSSTSTIAGTSTLLVHPFNNPLCAIVCQATVLSNAECRSRNTDSSFCSGLDHSLNQPQPQMDPGCNAGEPGSTVHPSDVSLFEELETARGSSWQYELQQLKFANQRLHEELSALEGARGSGGPGIGSSPSLVGVGPTPPIPLGQSIPSSSSTSSVPVPQQSQMSKTQLPYAPLLPSMLSSLLRPPNGLHEQDPPSSEWSSLAGANGQGSNPLKRSWRSEDGPAT